jgi:hypothetical protein
MMLFKGILVTGLLVASASANPGLLHDEAHHTHEVLENIHVVPHCAYSCIFHDTYPGKFAPDCVGLKGIEYGACLCKSCQGDWFQVAKGGAAVEGRFFGMFEGGESKRFDDGEDELGREFEQGKYVFGGRKGG